MNHDVSLHSARCVWICARGHFALREVCLDLCEGHFALRKVCLDLCEGLPRTCARWLLHRPLARARDSLAQREAKRPSRRALAHRFLDKQDKLSLIHI